MNRGSDGAIDIEYYRQSINGLYDQNRIFSADRDSRLNQLLSAYDSYKSKRINKQSFENIAQ